jgi:methyltransferase (TIGR00027 family)
MAARTRFFDDFFTEAGAAGIRQAVILASGLDARSYRLGWPDGTVVFEIDQPEVIAFKTSRMAELGAEPTAALRTIGTDLRRDWPAALAAAGFDDARPTAWIAEGLLGYLPPDAQDRLLDQISELSAPGSRVGVEGVPQPADTDAERVRERMQSRADQWRAHGFDIDFAGLVFLGDRTEVVAYLRAHGWTAASLSTNELLTRYGFMPLDPDEGFAGVVYVSAKR